MKRSSIIVILIAMAELAAGLLAQANPFFGIWKLNLTKSNFSPGPPPLSQTTTIEAAGPGMKHTTTGIAANGSAILFTYTNYFSGGDEPITGTGPNGADTISAKRINANTIEAAYKKSGKIVQTSRAVVSKDGRLRTVTSTGTNQSGQATSTVTVYDKQ
jgi:hypothetical protein